MAARYWVGGTGNWSDTAHWAGSSGGASGVTIPGSSDDVFFDSNSGVGVSTINQAFSINSLDCSGGAGSPGNYAGTLTHSSVLTIAGNGTLFKLVAGMTYNGASALVFTGTSGTTLVTMAGKNGVGSITINGAGGTVQLQDAFAYPNFSTGNWTITAGTLDTNGQLISKVGDIRPNGGTLLLNGSTVTCATITWPLAAGAGTLTAGAATITVNGAITGGSSGTFNMNSAVITCQTWNSVSTTYNAGTSSLTITLDNGTPAIFGGTTFYDVTFTGNGTLAMTTGSTGVSWHSLTITKAQMFQFQSASSYIFSGTLMLQGRSDSDRLIVTSDYGNTNSPVSLTAAAVSLAYVDLWSLAGHGVASPFTGTRIGIIGNTTGITGDTSRTLYWVGGIGSYSSTTHWSTSSGGSSGAAIPLPQDDVIFDDNSFSATGQTVTVDSRYLGRDVTWNTTKTPVWAFGSAPGQISNLPPGGIYTRNLTLCSGMTVTGTGSLTCLSNVDTSHTYAGVQLTTALKFTARNATPTFTLQSALSTTGEINIGFGSGNNSVFDANGKAVTVGSYIGFRWTIKMGSGTWTCKGSWTQQNPNSATGITAVGGTLVLQNDTASQISFDSGSGLGGSSITFNNIQFAGSGAGGWLVVRSQTFANFICTTAGPLVFTATITITVTGTITAVGGTTTAGKFTWKSSVNGTAWNLSKASGTVTVSFVSIQDSHASGGATFNDSPQSMSVSGNTGWNFNPYPETFALTQSSSVAKSKTVGANRSATETGSASVRRVSALLRRTTERPSASISRATLATRSTTGTGTASSRRTALLSRRAACATGGFVSRVIGAHRSTTELSSASVERAARLFRAAFGLPDVFAFRDTFANRSTTTSSAGVVRRATTLLRRATPSTSVAVGVVVGVIRRLALRASTNTTFGLIASARNRFALRSSETKTNLQSSSDGARELASSSDPAKSGKSEGRPRIGGSSN